jgi:hypothetical protein
MTRGRLPPPAFIDHDVDSLNRYPNAAVVTPLGPNPLRVRLAPHLGSGVRPAHDRRCLVMTHFRSTRRQTLRLKRPPAPENMPREPRTADIHLTIDPAGREGGDR